MLKVKLINEKTPLKIKMVAKFPSVILANLQDKETTPTKVVQVVVADKNYDGLSKVIVNPIPDEYIIPTGELEIIQNGIYDVSSKVSAKVNVPEKQLGTKTITSNGTYKAIDDNLDGYSEVNVSTSSVDINDYFSDTIKAGETYQSPGYTYSIKKVPSFTITGNSCKFMFYGLRGLVEAPILDLSNINDIGSMFTNCNNLINIPNYETKNVINMNSTFSSCYLLKTIPQYDTKNVSDFGYCFSNSSNLEILPELNAQNAININYMFYNNSNLTIFGGLKDLGKAYSTTQSANYSNYKLNLSYSNNLTHDSLMNIINKLYDIATRGCNPQQLVLGSTNLAKLTEEEIQVAQLKGWSLS